MSPILYGGFYIKKISIVYVKFKFYWTFYMFSG